MKIVQVLSTVAGGGAEVFVTQLSIALAKMPNVEIYILTYHDIFDDKGRQLKSELENNNIKYIKVGQGGHGITKFSKPFWGFNRELRKIKPDVVHVHHLSASVLLFALWTFFKFKFKLVITLHNSYKLPKLPKFIIPYYFKKFDGIISCSDYVKSDFVYEPIREQIYSIPNGIDIERVLSLKKMYTKSEMKKHLGFGNDELIFLNIGSMILYPVNGDTRKGHHLMIEAMKILKEANMADNCKMVFLGDGPERTKLEVLVNENDLNNHIIFKGIVDNVLEYTLGCDLIVMPSYIEGLSIAMIECACAGLPAILSANPAFLPFKEDSTIYLKEFSKTELAEALIIFIKNWKEITAKGLNNAGKFGEMFDVNNVAKKHLELYQNLFKN